MNKEIKYFPPSLLFLPHAHPAVSLSTVWPSLFFKGATSICHCRCVFCVFCLFLWSLLHYSRGNFLPLSVLCFSVSDVCWYKKTHPLWLFKQIIHIWQSCKISQLIKYLSPCANLFPFPSDKWNPAVFSAYSLTLVTASKVWLSGFWQLQLILIVFCCFCHCFCFDSLISRLSGGETNSAPAWAQI